MNDAHKKNRKTADIAAPMTYSTEDGTSRMTTPTAVSR